MYRWLIALFALPLLAQNEWVLPPPPTQIFKPDALSMRVFRTPLTVTQPRAEMPSLLKAKPAAKPCAIPLTNVLRFRQPDPPMPKYKPGGIFMREFPVPAPSCEDGKRK